MSISSSNEAKWYVVHTYSGYENKVKTNLEKIIENRGISDLIMEVRVPVEKIIETNADGVQKEVEVKIFPSYVLVKMIMTDETWHVVRNITGSTGFVGPGSRPVPLTDSEVEALGVETHKERSKFAKGDDVKITVGPMAGFTGKVDSISENGKKITVLASVFGRETPVELDATSVQIIKE
ncbi:MAG: transcription termination/antitermination factor NusG [Clostridia bacterium]|nr:transcription termination/antitermination factor NusG [Clostridia bacterium]